jgi:uncharacterized protein YkwD
MPRPGLLAVLAIVGSSLLFVVALPGAAAERRGAPCPGADTPPDQLKTKAARTTILCLLNLERSSRGLPPLRANKRLHKASQKHNRLMDGTGCFAHLCPREKPLSKRVKKTGYFVGASSFAVAENIAWGGESAGSPVSIVDAWMHSSGHRANILSPDLSEIGIGFSLGSPNDGSEVAGTYTTDFGHRVTRSAAVTVPPPVAQPEPLVVPPADNVEPDEAPREDEPEATAAP